MRSFTLAIIILVSSEATALNVRFAEQRHADPVLSSRAGLGSTDSPAGIFGGDLKLPDAVMSIVNQTEPIRKLLAPVTNLASSLAWPLIQARIAQLQPVDVGIFRTLNIVGKEFDSSVMTHADVESVGSGPYPAHMTTDSTLPNTTIFAPIKPPPDSVKMPVVIWNQGGCFNVGSASKFLLREIASHGYLVLSNGPPGVGTLFVNDSMIDMKEFVSIQIAGQTRLSTSYDAMDWVIRGGGDRFGNIDPDSIITGGTSCGGLAALSLAYKNPRVKTALICNSGIIDDKVRPMLNELNIPLGYFIGGEKDVAYSNAEQDFKVYHSGILKANIDSGHPGTFHSRDGGKFGKAVVDWLQWRFRDVEAAQRRIMKPRSNGSLVSQNWSVDFKNLYE